MVADRAPNVRHMEEIVRQFTELWWTEKQTTVFRNQFLGVPTLQHPFDAWVTQEIITEVRPDVIVECGTFCGGSALMWSLLLEQINPSGLVLTVDIEDHTELARCLPAWQRVETIVGSSIAPAIVAEVHRRASGKRTLVILDSNHAKDHVLGELHAYADLVSAGSYLIVQDGVVNGHPVEPEYGPGPFEAVAEFLGSTDEFRVDETRERMLLTFNPRGFLRRV
jgi:cephalosporin hydroxylase